MLLFIHCKNIVGEVGQIHAAFLFGYFIFYILGDSFVVNYQYIFFHIFILIYFCHGRGCCDYRVNVKQKNNATVKVDIERRKRSGQFPSTKSAYFLPNKWYNIVQMLLRHFNMVDKHIPKRGICLSSQKEYSFNAAVINYKLILAES